MKRKIAFLLVCMFQTLIAQNSSKTEFDLIKEKVVAQYINAPLKAKNEGHALGEIYKDKSLRNTYIHFFRKHSILSLRDLGLLFGGLSESTVCKILNQK